MTIHRGLFVRATGTAPSKVGTTPNESRLALAALFAENAPGVPRSGVLLNSSSSYNINMTVYPDPTVMQYQIDPCHVVMNRATAEGVYVVSFTGVTNIPTDPAPATGSRWDIIYVKQNDTDKGDANNSPQILVAKGTAAASPTKPAVPTGGMALAEARIYAGTVATMEGLNTFTTVHPYTALRGEPIPVRNTTERATITGVPGKQVLRIDRENEIQTYTGMYSPSGWEWLGTPRRFYADTTTFDSTSNNTSKLVGQVFGQNFAPYARKMRVNGRLAVSSGAIASGILAVAVSVSLNTNVVTNSQAKSRLSFVPPGGYWLTGAAETDWVVVPANNDGAPKIWIEYFVASAVNTASTATSVQSHLWVDVLPADD